MAKFISMEKDERGLPTKHVYEAKDGTRYSARYAAIAMASCDAHDELGTFREAMKMRQEREFPLSCECVTRCSGGCDNPDPELEPTLAKLSSPAGGDVREVLDRVTGHLETWANDHPDERTSEIDAAIYCARQLLNAALSPYTSAAEPVAMDNGLSGYSEFTPITVRSSTAPAAVESAQGVKEAVEAEREACAVLVDTMARYASNRSLLDDLHKVSDAIRSRASLATEKEG